MKTAVEWLVDKMLSQDWYTYKSLEYIKQAKEMEKQQIIEAHGDKLKTHSGTTNFEYYFSGEQYYDKTFKSE